MPNNIERALSEAHSRWLEPPEDVVVGTDWAGEDIYEGEEVYVSPDDEIIVVDGIIEFIDEHFQRAHYEVGGLEYD